MRRPASQAALNKIIVFGMNLYEFEHQIKIQNAINHKDHYSLYFIMKMQIQLNLQHGCLDFCHFLDWLQGRSEVGNKTLV